jgi:hypothetical protein
MELNMPDPNEYEDEQEWMKVCVPKMLEEGKDQEQAVGACMGMWANKEDAAKFRVLNSSIKAVGDWELDVLAIPFNSKDSDGQWFDENTDIMPDTFSTPLAVYQHGIKQGAKGLQDKLIVIGKTQAGSLEKKKDGWHIRVVLDKAVEVAKKIMEAAKNGLVAVSSGSIAHLARLDIGNKIIPYEKNRQGRIAVWPFAEISLWEKGNGNMQPANRFASALPAVKAIYREAGLPFPKITEDTYGDSPEAGEAARRAKVEKVKAESELILLKIKEY